MGVICNPELVCAVSEAGGFGFLATIYASDPETVRKQVQEETLDAVSSERTTPAFSAPVTGLNVSQTNGLMRMNVWCVLLRGRKRMIILR